MSKPNAVVNVDKLREYINSCDEPVKVSFFLGSARPMHKIGKSAFVFFSRTQRGVLKNMCYPFKTRCEEAVRRVENPASYDDLFSNDDIIKTFEVLSVTCETEVEIEVVR